MQISPHVFLVASGQLGCGLTHAADCNAYALRSASGRWILFDTGCGADSNQIARELEQNHLRATDCAAIIISHGHLDHAGGAAFFARHLRAPVWTGAQTARWLREGDEEAIGLAGAKRGGIYGAEFRLEPCAVARELGDGETWNLDELQLRWHFAPGHAPDLGALEVRAPKAGKPGAMLFSSDCVFHGGRVLAGATRDCAPAAYAKSLRALAQRDVESLFPGHGLWVLNGAQAHLRAVLPFLDRTLLPPNLI